jgi:Tol biopolymer transport system component
MLRRWFTWVIIGVAIAVGVVAGVNALRSSDQPASTRPSGTTAAENSDSTLQSPPPFADIHGWIAYGDNEGIWAIDPTRPEDDSPQPIRLSDEPGRPVAWSRDGSKLLIIRVSVKEDTAQTNVSILNASGVEKRVARMNTDVGFASLSPDGSQIIYSRITSGIYLANADGEDARLLKSRHLQHYASDKRSFRTNLFAEAFSPDGRQIAYVDGMGDWGNSIRVMDADGSHVRVLIDWRRGGRQKEVMDKHVYNLAWSPDGSRLAFDTDAGIWVVGLDGSGLRLVIRHGGNPSWSPDGSRLAYATSNLGEWGPLRIADADGSHVQTVGDVRWPGDSGRIGVGPGAWNPVEPTSS